MDCKYYVQCMYCTALILYILHWQTFQHVFRLHGLVYSSKSCRQQQHILHSPAVLSQPAAGVLCDPIGVLWDPAGVLCNLSGALLPNFCTGFPKVTEKCNIVYIFLFHSQADLFWGVCHPSSIEDRPCTVVCLSWRLYRDLGDDGAKLP